MAFWLIGLLNNVPYVVMIAGAKNISEGGTALVFIANALPSLLVKISSPYWFDRVCYRSRIKYGSILMASSFCFVAWFGKISEGGDQNQNGGDLNMNVIMQLFGVALGSAQGGLGEATLLALSGKADSVIQNEMSNDDELYRVVDESNEFGSDIETPEEDKKSMCIAAFSSGTGFAGIAGFLFVFICTRVFGLSLPGTLTLALIFPILYWHVYEKYLAGYMIVEVLEETSSPQSEISNELVALSSTDSTKKGSENTLGPGDDFQDNPPNIDCDVATSEDSAVTEKEIGDNLIISKMSAIQRFCLVLSLWPYMVPLFVVYAAEYAMQSGTWASIGFPVDDEDKRNSFYVASNWVVSLYLLFIIIMDVTYYADRLATANLILLSSMYSLFLLVESSIKSESLFHVHQVLSLPFHFRCYG